MQVKDDQADFISQIYSDLYPTQVAPRQGDQPKRRRRRKSKSEGSASCLKKRKLSDEQVNMLEISFGCEHKLESERKDRLAAELSLDPRQVAVWFQNRRARWKNKRLEEEYSKLKNKHENLVVEKCRLETEVLSLKDQLKDTKKEVKELQERTTLSSSLSSPNHIHSSNSPSSSMTIEYQTNVMDPQLYNHQYGMATACLDGMFYGPNNDYVSSMDWMNNLWLAGGAGNMGGGLRGGFGAWDWLREKMGVDVVLTGFEYRIKREGNGLKTPRKMVKLVGALNYEKWTLKKFRLKFFPLKLHIKLLYQL
ncbi:hypothetical protein KSS87_017970 [Heliosperma pusillum]|nr:hypothetical protein KSS87_017970 [Heliosperma pusillum]